MSLFIVLPFAAADVPVTISLLQWCNHLGYTGYDVLLIADAKCRRPAVDAIKTLAKKSFASVGCVTTNGSLPNEKWPIGPNWMFETALIATQPHQRPWLWLEPDCVPTRREWASLLEEGYEKCNRPFFGQIIEPRMKGLPERMLSGVAIYPPDAHARLYARVREQRLVNAFDVACADLIVPHTHHTKLIWNFHGEKGLPPTYVAERKEGQPRNALPLSIIPRNTVLAHRCKDGSLAKLLADRPALTAPILLPFVRR